MFVLVSCCGLFGNSVRLLGSASLLVRVLVAFIVNFVDSQVVVQALSRDAFAPAVAFHFFNVILELLAICKTLVALNVVVIIFKLLMLVLRNRFVLLKAPA